MPTDMMDVHADQGERWTRTTWFWLAAAALLVVLTALIPAMNNDSIALPDDGVYAAQAAALASGTWSEPRPAPALDDHGRRSVVVPDFAYGDRQVPYLKHPLFPAVLGSFYRIGGFAGLLAFSVIGTWAAALAAGLMARGLDRRYGIPALLLTGLGTPILFDAYLVSGHTAAAALCGFMALGLRMSIEERRWLSLLYVLPCAALAVSLRSEGVVAVAAAALVIGFMALRIRPMRVDWPAVGSAISVLFVAVAAYVMDTRLSDSIKVAAGDMGIARLRGIPADRDPLGVLWVSLVRPGEFRPGSVMPGVVFAFGSTVIAAIAVKVAPRRTLVPMTLVVVSTVALTAQQFGTPWLVTGLLATFPLLPAGLILLHRGDMCRPTVVRNLGIALVSTIAITATTYSAGGAAEWGGRFYHLLIPLVVPVVVIGLHNGHTALQPRQARVMAVALILSTSLLSLLGLRFIALARHQYRTTIADTVRFVTTKPNSENGSKRKPLVVVIPAMGGGMGRMFWQQDLPFDAITYEDSLNADAFIARLDRLGYSDVTVVTNMTGPDLAILGTDPPRDGLWGARRIQAVPGAPYTIIDYGPA